MTETLAAHKTGAQSISSGIDDQNSVAYMLFDANQILKDFNPKASRMFGLNKELIGKPAQQVRIISGFSFTSFLQEAYQAKADIEKQFKTEEGRWLQLCAYTGFLKDSHNTPNGAVVTFLDITDRISDLKELERLNADHETFVYTVSHDFRGPLTNMILLIDLLKAAFGSEDKKEFERLIQMMNKSAQDMKKMINEITDFSRSAVKVAERLVSVSVESVLQDVILTMKDDFIRTRAQVEVKLNVAEVPFSRSDLRSILCTLMRNAIRFAKSNQPPRIIVSSERSGDYFILSVQDFGMGMDDNRRKELFSRFTNVKNGEENNGIGLYIANKIISNSGGRLEVESTKGVGTIFTVYLRR
jgi:PAS domain S-box-containing protein